MQSILEALDRGRLSHPDQQAWTFLNDKGDPVDSYTYKELDNASSHLAETLLNYHKLSVGDRVLLVFFPGLDFTVSLVACFKAGLIGVPVFPPDPHKLKKDLHHFVNIQLSCGATTVLTNSAYNFAKKIVDLTHIFSTESVRWPELKWISVDDTLKKGKSIDKSKSKAAIKLPAVLPESIAFLQYTSGSTSDPKGVMISHENLAHNLTLIIRELQADQTTVVVSWLPQYHDMGLIGSYLGIVYCGGRGNYISPISFLKDPTVWVKAMSRFKATHTQAPNFAYPLVSRKFKEALHSEPHFPTKVAATLDLTSLRHMINAAEPVDYHAIMEFYDTFGAYGLKNNVVIPTYGLAEHTVFVCSGGKQVISVSRAALEAGKVEIIGEVGELLGGNTGVNHTVSEAEAQQIVGCGYFKHGEGVDLVIVNSDAGEVMVAKEGDSAHDVHHAAENSTVTSTINTTVNTSTKPSSVVPHPDPTTDHIASTAGGRSTKGLRVLEEGVVGEIWIASKSKAKGYWNQAELSLHEFHAHVDRDTSGLTEMAAAAVHDGYLRTGDLGFLYNSELFICGRMKDLIIVRGSNHYPQDIERTAEAAQADYLRAGCSAAFSLAGTVKHHTEAVVYIAELKVGVAASRYPEIARAIRDIVSTSHGLALSTVCLLQTRSIPKTTSGKIARAWCRRGFLETTLQVVYRLDAEKEVEAEVAGEVGTPGNSAKGASGYAKVSTSDPAATATVDGAVTPAVLPLPAVTGKAHTAEEVRALPLTEIAKQLEDLLLQVAAQGPSPLTGPLDQHMPVTAMGLDSMTLVQFKGVLEKRFHCDIPDDFLFTSMATLDQLAQSAHLGTLTPEQKAFYEGHSAEKTAGGADGGKKARDPNAPSTVIVQSNKQPCCPWFTICF